jgi:ankyrin repeat protein
VGRPKGADVNGKTPLTNWALLHYAELMNRKDVADLLKRHGAKK